jgi:hypothetical protein
MLCFKWKNRIIESVKKHNNCNAATDAVIVHNVEAQLSHKGT